MMMKDVALSLFEEYCAEEGIDVETYRSVSRFDGY